jgi:endonuclease/exonuclease/phosphatase family metal-dependent hydrolase
MKVVSWNILADEFIAPRYYKNIPIKLFDRKERFKIIVNNIIQEDADVYLLQEVMKKEYISLKNKFNNYLFSDLVRIDWKYPNEYNKKSESGNIIMFKKNKFSNLKQIDDNNCIVVVKRKSKEICFANIHLDDLSQLTRYKQIENIINKTNLYKRCIIAGDFNQNYIKTSSLYMLLKNNGFKASQKKPKEFSFFISKSQLIDNIFYRGFKTKKENVLNICGKKSIENIECQLKEYGSDHFPVMTLLK